MKDLEVYNGGTLIGRLRVDSIGEDNTGNMTVMETYKLDDRQAAALDTPLKVALAQDFKKMPQTLEAIKTFASDNSLDLRMVPDNANTAKFLVNGIVFTKDTLLDGSTGITYSESAAATGMSGTFEYRIIKGILPTGLSLNDSSGAITGTPTVAGTSAFIVRAIDSVSGVPADKGYSITIA